MWRDQGLPATLVVAAWLAVAITSCTAGPQRNQPLTAETAEPRRSEQFAAAESSPDGMSVADTFGLREVLVTVEERDLILVAGLAPSRYSDPLIDDLVLGGAVNQDGVWRVRLLDPMPSGYDDGRGCTADEAPQLVPTGPAIVGGCITGGTSRVGYVTVLGVDEQTRAPRVLLTASCGAMSHEVDGDVLRIESSGPQPAAHKRGARQPDLALRWDGHGFTADRPSAYSRFCVERGGEFGWSHGVD